MIEGGDVGTILLKGIVGGCFVVAFAVFGEVLRPRGVAGILAAAPAVALGSLFVTLIVDGSSSAAAQSTAMVVGAVALLLACVGGLEAVKRFGSFKGSVLSAVLWLVAAFAGWGVVLR